MDYKKVNEYLECLSDDAVIYNFYMHLKNIDLSKWSPWKDRPITEAYKDIQSVNVPVVAKWLNEKCMNYMHMYKEQENTTVRQNRG